MTRPVVTLAAAGMAWAVITGLELVAPMFPFRRRLDHDALNLGFGALNAVLGLLLFGGALAAVAAAAGQAGFGLLRRLAVPPPWDTALALLLFDFWQYLWHRLNHTRRLLWRFHAVHHADAEMNATTAIRFHPGEIALSAAARLLVLPVIGMTLPQLLLYEAVLLPVIFFHHSNIRVPARLDAALRLLVATPWMHWVHHSRLPAEMNSNYSSVLSVWDRLFGSFRLRPRPEEIRMGLAGADERVWRSPLGALAMPFRRKTAPPGARP